jgi:hypothetical protein
MLPAGNKEVIKHIGTLREIDSYDFLTSQSYNLPWQVYCLVRPLEKPSRHDFVAGDLLRARRTNHPDSDVTYSERA